MILTLVANARGRDALMHVAGRRVRTRAYPLRIAACPEQSIDGWDGERQALDLTKRSICRQVFPLSRQERRQIQGRKKLGEAVIDLATAQAVAPSRMVWWNIALNA
jgi:hypothetical protein